MRVPLHLRFEPQPPTQRDTGPTTPGSKGEDGNGGGGGSDHTRIIVATVLVVAGILLVIAAYFYLARLEKKRLGYSPHPWQPWIDRLKNRWARSKYARAPNDHSEESGRGNGATSSEMSRTSRPTTGAGANNGVDRNTSIRSIMTLPAYAPAPRPTEQVIGREGDRAGIDVVIEYPETADEEEARREQQMASLYQIRLARRAEAAEREEQRRLRREARARGDNATLEELRLRSRIRAESASSSLGAPGASMTSLGSASLIQEHAARERERRISSVSYADVGLARHDGSRVRANSNDSDRPLLTSVASAGMRSRSGSNLAQHDRTRSASSVLSLSTTNSEHQNQNHNHNQSQNHLPRDGDQSGSGSTDFEEISLQPTSTSSHGTPAESDIAEARRLIPDEPPQYEHVTWGDAPPYEHRHVDDVDSDDESEESLDSDEDDDHGSSVIVRTPSQPPTLPILQTLPAIEITAHTPASSAPTTPVTPRREAREGHDA